MSYIISTKRLGLRKWKDEDIQPFTLLNADTEVMQYFPSTLSKDQTLNMIRRIKKDFAKNGFGLYAVEIKESLEFIGFTGFSIPAFEAFFTPCIEIGWRFKKEVWGNGFATEAAIACLQFGFKQLEFDKIVSFTAAVNNKSENVMKRIGMQNTGEFDHPGIDKSSSLCRHVLYEIKRAGFLREPGP
ncbi:MAG: GNAT family N-acetyltransferase [Bacteroidetes bacterium]|nr:GNAT family N-acetyltransferase [Bacteroidota bacterium]